MGSIRIRAVMRKVPLTTLLLLVVSMAAASGLPPEVADRIEAATMLSETETFVGSYTMTTVSVVQKPNGKARKNIEAIVRSARHGDGTVEHRLERMTENGEDVTEKNRDDIEDKTSQNRAADGKEDTDDGDDELIDFVGETADHYDFGPPRRDRTVVMMDFEPRPEHRETKGMTAGTVAWDNETLDPLWMDIKALKAPGPLKELEMRVEFARLDQTIFIDRVFTKGVAKIILITREFETDIRITDVRADGDQSSTSSMEMSKE